MGFLPCRRRFILDQIMRKLAESAGITLNGPNPWDIQVNDERWYKRVYRDKVWVWANPTWMDGGTASNWMR